VTRLFRFAFALGLTTAIVCTVVVGLARSQPLVNVLPEVQFCGNVGCFLDIVPGQTSWDNAVSRLRLVQGLVFDQNLKAGSLPNRARQFQLYLNENRRIDEIDLILRDPEVTLGWLIAQYGHPCAIVPLSPYILGIKYSGLAFIIEDNSGIAQRTSRIKQANILGVSMNPCEATPYDVNWRGFTRIPKR